MLATLATGEYLHLLEVDGRERRLVFTSDYNLRGSKCNVALSDGFVVSTDYSESSRLARIAAVAAIASLVGLAAFRLL